MVAQKAKGSMHIFDLERRFLVDMVLLELRYHWVQVLVLVSNIEKNHILQSQCLEMEQ